MTLAIFAAIAYGVLSMVGGFMGYQQAGSKASLISGIASGILLIVGGVLQLLGITGGLLLSALVAIALIVVFAVRLTKTKKFMPAGLMLIAGLITLGILVPALLS